MGVGDVVDAFEVPGLAGFFPGQLRVFWRLGRVWNEMGLLRGIGERE